MNKRILLISLIILMSAVICGTSWSAPTGRIDLAGQWKFSVDPDNTGIQKGWQTSSFNAGSWRLINVPATWESQGVTQPNPQWTQDTKNTPYSGYAWYRKTVMIPAGWTNRKIYLNMGIIDDQDSTFINGVLIAETAYEGGPSVYQSSEIPASVIKAGQSNVISVRVLDISGNGGIVSGPVSLTLGEPETAPSPATAPVKPVPAAPSVPPEDSVNVGSDTVVGPGQTVRDAVAVRGNVIVNGHVTGDAVAVMGDVILSDEGRIDGDAVAVLGHVTKINGGNIKQHIGGEVVNVMPRSFRGDRVPRGNDGGLFIAAVGIMILMALLAAAITALFPRRIETVASTFLDKPGMSALYGIAALLLIIAVPVVLILTCVGIILIPVLVPVELAFAVVSWIFGVVAVDFTVGRKISTAVNRPILNAALAAAVGSIILSLINLIPILGGLFVFALSVIGFGAVLMSGFGTDPDWFARRFRRPELPPPPIPPAAPEPPVSPVAPEPPAAPEPPIAPVPPES